MDASGSGQEQVVGSCEYGNETSGFKSRSSEDGGSTDL
jgi:hypothetical protein